MQIPVHFMIISSHPLVPHCVVDKCTYTPSPFQCLIPMSVNFCWGFTIKQFDTCWGDLRNFVILTSHIDLLKQGVTYLWKLILVHGSYLKQKKFTDTKSLGIKRPYLAQQPVNIPLICQIRGDKTMSFRCDHALKQLVHGFSSAPYLVELGSRELTNT